MSKLEETGLREQDDRDTLYPAFSCSQDQILVFRLPSIQRSSKLLLRRWTTEEWTAGARTSHIIGQRPMRDSSLVNNGPIDEAQDEYEKLQLPALEKHDSFSDWILLRD
jgi:hypothetical protein